MTTQDALITGGPAFSEAALQLRTATRPWGMDLRPVNSHDLEFLRELYASTRWNELSPTGWPDESKHAFLAQQWDAQRQYYARHYPLSDNLIIAHREGGRIGRLFLDWADEIRLVDIALAPAWRGRGLGTRLLELLCQQADRGQRPVVAHVETFNPARRLYARLGFAIEDNNQIYLRMRRAAAALEATA